MTGRGLARYSAAASAVALATLVASCSGLGIGRPSTELRFTDVALEAGIQDRENMARAAGAADLNGDGWLDLYIGNPGGTSRIWWNNGPGRDGKITFRPGQVLLDGPEQFAFAAAFGDYDNDGNPDLFIATGGADGALSRVESWDYLFHNQGGGSFVDVTDQAGVKGHHNKDTGELEAVSSSQGAWGDYDRDGCLDLFVSNQLDTGNTLFHSNCDGTFTDVTKPAGVDIDTRSMAATWADFDNDGWLDLLVPHAKGGHQSLYRNNRDGTFTRITSNAFASPWATWASTAADFNQDGLVDGVGFAWHQVRTNAVRAQIYDVFRSVGNFFLGLVRTLPKEVDQDSEGLYINRGGMTFEDQADSSGFSPKGESTGASMGNQAGDLNNDGLPELYTANGAPNSGDHDRLYENITRIGDPQVRFRNVSYLIDYPAPDDPNFRLTRPVPAYVLGQKTLCGAEGQEALRNAADTGGRGVFGCASIPVGPNEPKFLPDMTPGTAYKAPFPYRGHAVVFLDYNHDNKIDILAVKGGPITMPWTMEPNRLFRNDTPNVGALMTLKLIGRLSNRDGSGARIVAHPSLNGVVQPTRYADVADTSGFGSSRWGETYIGLGQADKATLEIHWPSGVVQVLRDVAVNQRLTVKEEDALAFGDSFDQAIVPSLWERRSGDWAWQDRQAQSCGGTLATQPGAYQAQDGVLTAKVTVDREGSAGIVGRLGGSGGGIAALITPRGLEAGTLATVHQSAPVDIGPIKPGRMIVLRMTLRGDTVQVEADGSQPVTIHDDSPSAGPLGLMVAGGCARFDYVGAGR